MDHTYVDVGATGAAVPGVTAGCGTGRIAEKP